MILQSPHDFCILILGQKSYGGRRETAMVQSPYRDFDKNHNKKSKAYDACVYCYHRRRSTKTPTMYTLDTRTAVLSKNIHQTLTFMHCIN